MVSSTETGRSGGGGVRGGAARVCGAEPGAVCAARRGCVRRGVLGVIGCSGGTPHPLTTHRTSPSGKSGVAVGLFSENSPLDCFLQNARPSGLRPSGCASKQSFGLFRCSAWLILHKQSTGLFMEKRLCSRALSLRVNPQGEGFWVFWEGRGAGGSSSDAARLLHLARTETPGVGSRFPSRKP